MRNTLLILLVALAATCFGQYKPKSGETVMQVDIENRGTLYILMHTKTAPKTTGRILELAGNGFYDGQRFFKVTKQPKPFLVQVGDPNSKKEGVNLSELGSGGTGQTIPYENSGYSNVLGAVGLAARPDDRNSGDSQFYILLGPHKFLDGNYTVFGQVVEGLDILNKIELGDRIKNVTILRG